jgi:hypothetical protein
MMEKRNMVFMKRKALVLLCMGMILTGMTGCSAGVKIAELTQDDTMVITENPADGSSEESGISEEEPNTDISGTTDLNEEAEADQNLQWKDAYKALMKELVNGNFGEDLPFFGYLPGDPEYDQLTEYGYGVNGYYLYDVDKDGVPELVVKFGTGEADFDGRLYLFDGEHAVYAGELPLGHSAMATCPAQNGIILNYGHMGVAYMQKISLVDGELTFEDLLEESLSDDPDDSYTLPGEVIPGADFLSLMKPGDTLPIDTYEIWSANMNADIDATATADEMLEQRYLDTILHNGTVVGITADGYGGDTGTCTMEEYLGPNMVNPYSDSGMVVEAYTCIDMNEDGTEECVLRLREADQEETDDISGKWVVLSEQDSTVYAYCINYQMTYTLLENGAFRPNNEFDTNNFRMLFDKDQCFLYYTGLDEKHAEAEWISIAEEELNQ